jgi:hypothetical protein
VRDQVFHDPADAAKFSRDLGVELDSSADEIVEAFLRSLRKMRAPALPASQLELHATIARLAAVALRDDDGLGGAIAALREKGIDEARQEAVMQTIALVSESGNDPRKLAADSIAFAAGMHAMQHGKSQIDLASESGVGRAAVSKRVTAGQRQLGLPPSRGCKDDDAQNVYQERAHKVHGTDAKQVTKEARLLATSIKRLTRWLERILPELSEASDGPEATAMLIELFAPLLSAMRAISTR